MRNEYFKETFDQAARMVEEGYSIEGVWEYLESRKLNVTCEMVIQFMKDVKEKNRFNYWH